MIWMILLTAIILLTPIIILVIMIVRAPLGIEIPGIGFIELDKKGKPKHE